MRFAGGDRIHKMMGRIEKGFHGNKAKSTQKLNTESETGLFNRETQLGEPRTGGY